MQEVVRRIAELEKVPDYKAIINKAKKQRQGQVHPKNHKYKQRPVSAQPIYRFTDQQFLPKLDSIWQPNQINPKWNNQELVERIQWRRIQDVYPKDEITLLEDVLPADVQQGQIGDCYFISTLSSLAFQQPDEIVKIFFTREINEAGWYAMRLMLNGHPQIIVVDDYIPFDKVTKRPVFAGKKTKNIWPMLLEKAWAKVNGSYGGIWSGSSWEALKFLLPYPIEKWKGNTKEDRENMWKKISSALKGQYMITCASGVGDVEKSEAHFDALGLTSNHSFAISGVYNIKHERKATRLLKVSNPWNKQEWKGTWSDKDSRWTSELKDQVGFIKKHTGEFYIGLDDFCTYFDSTTICKLDSFNDHSSLKLTHEKGSHWLVKIKVSQRTHLAMTMSQIMQRFCDFKPSYMRMMLGKVSKSPGRPLEHIIGGFNIYSDTYTLESETYLDEGIYFAYLQCDWNTDFINSFAFSVLGYNVKIRQARNDEYPNFLKSCIKDFAKHKITDARTKEGDLDISAKHYLGELTAGYGFHYYQNESKIGTTMIETVAYKTKEGIDFEFKCKDPKKFYVELKPDTDQLLLFKRNSPKWQTNYNYWTHLKYTAKHLAKLAMSNGKKCKMESKQGQVEHMYYITHDFGYTFVFDNSDSKTTIDIYLYFETLKNLALTKGDLEISSQKPFWKFTIPPKSKIAKHLRKKDLDAGFSMSYKISHEFLKPGQKPLSIKEKLSPSELKDKELIQILKDRAEDNTFKWPKTEKTLKISYRYMFFETFFFWYFENNEPGYHFDGKFTFKLKNLKLDKSDEEEEDMYKVDLKPNQSMVRKMHAIEKDGAVSYSLSMSYFIKKV